MSQQKSRELSELYVKEVIHKYNPKFAIKFKKDSKLFMALKPIIKLVNPAFFTGYITTMFGVMWVTDDFFDKGDARDILNVTAHEGFHEYDRKRLPKFVFELMYLTPQILAIPFLLLAIIYSWWWLIAAVICLAPLPSYGRYHLEMRAYAMYKIWNKYIWESDDRLTDANVIRQMSGVRTYWGTWPFKKWIQKDLNKPVDESEIAYKDAVEFLKRHNLTNIKD